MEYDWTGTRRRRRMTTFILAVAAVFALGGFLAIPLANGL